MKKSRKAEIIGFSAAGGVMVALAILLPAVSSNLSLQLIFALVGLFLVQAGIWRITERTIRKERRFLTLRGEVGSFLSLVRTLNAQGVRLREENTEERWKQFHASVEALHDSVDRMADAAGREA